MRAIDKPDHLPVLGAPIGAHQRELTGAKLAEFNAAVTRRDFEQGDHQPDGLVLPTSYKDELMANGWRSYTIEMIPNDSSELPAVLQHAEEMQRLVCGIDPAVMGSDRTVVIMKGRQNGLAEAGRVYLKGMTDAMHDNMRMSAGAAARMVYDRMTDEEILAQVSTPDKVVRLAPSNDVPEAPDTPHEEVRNLLDDIMVDAGELSFAAADVLRDMIRTAIIDACEFAPALQRTLQTSNLSWRMASNIMLRLLGCAPGPRGRVVDEIAPDAYYPARLQVQRLITDPTDEVPRHEELRPERQRIEPAQDHGATRIGGGLVGAATALAAGNLKRSGFVHDRPGSEAGSGHALRAAEAADGRPQRQGREAGGVAPAVGTAAWLRTEEGHKAMQMMINMTEDQRKAVNTAVRRHLGD